MRCRVCAKQLDLVESRHIGLCYSCRRPAWDTPTLLVPVVVFDPFAAIDQLRKAFVSAEQLNPEIDQKLTELLGIVNRKK